MEVFLDVGELRRKCTNNRGARGQAVVVDRTEVGGGVYGSLWEWIEVEVDGNVLWKLVEADGSRQKT